MKKLIQSDLSVVAASITVAMFALLSSLNVRADGLASDYDMLPPLISTAGAGDTPNVLLMLDTSGSMNEDKSGTYKGSNYYLSKTIIARQAFGRILDKFAKNANMGLMAFEPAPSFSYSRSNSSVTAQQYEWSGNNLGNTSNYAINRGYLYIPIGSVDPADTTTATVNRIAEFRARLGLDVVTQSVPLTNYYNLFQFSNTSYTSSTDYTNKRLLSEGGTPLEGTYLSALEYYQGSLSSSLRLSSITGTDATWPQTNQCDNRDFAILLTDGLPTVNADGTACGNCTTTQYNNNTTRVEAQAAALRNAGVKTYVIGFALGASGEAYLNRMAAAGGTQSAYFASDLTELLTVLESIFVDIINRTSSGTGAAVITNRGNGLSAMFQALYTPEKTDGNKTVNWVGSLQGIFIDDKQLLREDTNGDGLLGGYNVDRILEFRFDAAQDKTVVDRKLSSSSINPDTIADTVTSDLEDIKSIWSLRDRLGDLTNVLNQRSYGALASTGRRIYTSVDGKSLLNFGVIDPVSLAALDSDEATLRAEIAALDTAIGNESTTLNNSIVTLRTFANSDLTTALSDTNSEIAAALIAANAEVANQQALLDTAIANEAASAAVLATATSALATATSDRNAAQTVLTNANTVQTNATTAVATATTDRDTAQSVLNTATSDQIAAQAAVDTATTNRNDAQTVRDNAITTRDNAQTALTQATTNRDNAQTAVNDATTVRDDAQTAVNDATTVRDDAQTAVNDATTDRDNAQTAVNNATTARDSAQTTVNTAVTARDGAQSAYDTAVNDLNTAQNNYDAEVALDPGCVGAPCQTALADLNTATSNRNDAQTDLNSANTALVTAQNNLVTAQNTLDTASSTLATAQATLSTANTNLTNAQASLDAATVTYNTAQSNLTTAQTDLVAKQTLMDTATTDYNTAAADLIAAQADLDAKQIVLTNAQTALTDANTALSDAQSDLTAKQAALDAANTALTDANTAQAAAQTDFDAKQLVFDGATTDFNAATSVHDADVAALATVSADFTYANEVLTAAQDAETWSNSVAAIMPSLQDLLTRIDGIAGLDVAARDQLVLDVNAFMTVLQALLSSMPATFVDSALTDMNAEMANLFAQLQTATNQFTLSGNIYDQLVQLNSDMTTREIKQTALVSTQAQIGPVAYIKYMDDGIIGQPSDPDLTYTQRNDIVKWIRGAEVTGLRNRLIDYDKDGVDEVWRLGDIVHSTPAVVGRPSEAYYSRYADPTYKEYIEAKFNRRQMVYVGSNDGMLHAINAGFWDDANKGYVTRLASDTSSTEHPLGAEVWSYVPKAVLPHLQFIASQDYNHMFLVDGEPQVFDVNIFPNDTDHPKGWGTILVVNMRLGGGAFTVRVDEDGDGVTEDVVIRSSVMIFDVTNPEVEPTLIAELTDPNIGHSFGKAALVKNRTRSDIGTFDNPATNSWVLVFGSGPTEAETVTSTQNARLYAYDLQARDWVSTWTDNPEVLNLESNAFVGDAISMDWDSDYIDDAVYFGVDTGTAAAPDGQLARLRLRSDQGASGWIGNASVATMINVDRSIIGAPAMQRDTNGRRWISFGTGRLLVGVDNASSQQEYLYGVMEPVDSALDLTYGAASNSNLLDVSNINVYADGTVTSAPTGVDTFSQLQAYIRDNKDGWKRKLKTSGTAPSGRSQVHPAQYLQSMFYAEYVPNNDQCKPEGVSYLYDLNFQTGTAYFENNFSTTAQVNGPALINPSTSASAGMIGGITLIQTSSGVSLITQSTTGQIKEDEAKDNLVGLRRQSWRQIFDFGF